MQALDSLIAGNRRFAGGQPHYGHHVSAAAAASGDQRPYAALLGCIDSRVPLEAVFDQNFGSITVIRSGGHVLDRAVLASAEFAVTQLAVPLVMVLGHDRCGAVAATIAALESGRPPAGVLSYLVDEIAPAVWDVGLADDNLAAKATRRHVARTVDRLRRLPAVSESGGAVEVVGAVYCLDTARVELIDR